MCIRDRDEGCYDAAADLADQGCQIIFANSFEHETYILEAAGEYPEVQFCHATGTQAASSGLSNMHNYFTCLLYTSSPTPRDRYADLLIQGPIGQVFSQIHC